MTSFAELLLLSVLLINFLLLGSSRLGALIRAVALQGVVLAVLVLVSQGISLHSVSLATIALALKGVIIPWYLSRAMADIKIRREVEPVIGYIPTLLLGAVITALAFLFAQSLPLIDAHATSLLIPTALAVLGTGFLLLITRRKAITQVVGYLVFENGVFLIGLLLVDAIPLAIEAGILLDVLVGVFVMGIVMNHINREFSSINTENLCSLRD
ncbi:hydrogenase [Chrysiogenes arsenatis]|uniref:hydrogenase n=1 Tax=Chrysiogenes arsenatis TaxID=309797 RepID=UPI000423BE9B|nr:hydrogenase [Chrysiogenes arsenatis]